jgi:tripartite-type tricarboxylate transporter receptor subunit TctC
MIALWVETQDPLMLRPPTNNSRGNLIRTVLMFLMFAGLTAVCRGATAAEVFPSRTMSLIVANVAGGSADYVARVVAPKVSALINQNVLVDDRPGGTGVIGARAVISAPADGHMLLLNTVATVIVGPRLSTPAPFDPMRDLTPITTLASVPAILVVRAGLGIRTFGDLIAYAKANPGKIKAGSSGAGTLSALNVASLQKEADIEILHVPYKGAPPAINDMLGGQIDMMFSDVSFFLNLIRAGKLVALAAASPSRIPALPDLPTTAELGHGRLVAANIYSIFGPPKLAPALALKINAIFHEAIANPEVQAALHAQSAFVHVTTVEEFSALFRSEDQRLVSLIEDVAPSAAK